MKKFQKQNKLATFVDNGPIQEKKKNKKKKTAFDVDFSAKALKKGSKFGKKTAK